MRFHSDQALPILLKFCTILYIFTGLIKVRNKLDLFKTPPPTARKNAFVSSKCNLSSLFQKSLLNSITSASMDSFRTQCNSQFTSFNFFSISFRRRISARQNTHPGLRKTHTTADDFCQISFPFLLFILFGSSNRGASDTIVLVLAAAAAEEEEEEEDLFIIFSYGMKQSG